MAEKRSILFQLLGDSKGLEAATKRGKGALGGLSDTAKKVGLAVGLAFGADQVINQVGAAVSAASDYDESLNAVRVAAGDAADAIIAMGDDAAETMGLSRTQVNEFATAMSGFVGSMEQAGMDVDGVYEDLLGRTADFASVMNLSMDEAFTKFRSGLAGESEPLRAFGLDLSAAAVEAHALETGIIAAGEKMSEQQKVTARYSLLMQQTAKFQGDFAKTSGGLANSQRILQAELENVRIEVGQELTPVLTDLMGVAVDLAPALGTLARALGATLAPITRLTGSASDAIDEGDRLKATLVGLRDVVTTLGSPLFFVADAFFGTEEAAKSFSKVVDEDVVPAWGDLFTGTMRNAWIEAQGLRRELEDPIEPPDPAQVLTELGRISRAIIDAKRQHMDLREELAKPLNVPRVFTPDGGDFGDARREFERQNGG